MNRKLLSIIGTVFAIALVLVLKFVVQPMLELEQKKAAGQGWTAARTELLTKVKPFMARVFQGLDIPNPKIKTIGNCIVTKAITFLNGTGCDYHYVKSTTSKSDHIAKQEKCLKKVGFEKKLELFTVECAQQNLPDDWSLLRKAMRAEIDKSLKKKYPDAAKRKKVVDCMTKKSIVGLQKSKCRPINKQGKTFNSLFTKVVSCYKKYPEILEQVKKDAKQCMLAAGK